MKSFIGRRTELEILEQAYQGSGSAFIPVYGRRRIGKSELILHFLKGRTGLYGLGKQAPAGLQIREFLQEAARVLEEPLLDGYAAGDWKDALTQAAAKWKGSKKLIIALDEFQWMTAASPELPSILQDLWDRQWSRSGNILLILCGSYMGFMEREVLGRNSPLFGRRTAQIHLKPFGFQEAAEFHPSYSPGDRARTYFICGGVPLYLKNFSGGESVDRNIVQHILNEYAPLYREPDFLLREELREVEKYSAVLLALSSGSLPAKEISRLSQIGERSLQYYLQQLMSLGYVARRYPVNGEKPVSRHVRYAIEDPLLRFWFRFVFPNMSGISQLGGPTVFNLRIRPELNAYWGSCFERLCREALPELYRREKIIVAYEVGEYWDKNVQIDVVGFRDDNWTDLGECKWGTVKSIPSLYREMESKVTAYPNPRKATIGRRLFMQAPGPAPKDLPHFRWHSLEELYG